MKRYKVDMIISTNLISKWDEDKLKDELSAMITNAVNNDWSFDVTIESISIFKN